MLALALLRRVVEEPPREAEPAGALVHMSYGRPANELALTAEMDGCWLEQ